MMFTESLAAQAESRLLCILLVCVPKRLEMFVHVDDDRRHAEPCTLILKISVKFQFPCQKWSKTLKNPYDRVNINSNNEFQML